MPISKIEAKVVAAWQEAAADLGFQFTSPYIATAHSGKRFETLGLVHQFGAPLGVLISVGGEPSADADYPSGDGYREICHGKTTRTRYDRAEWIELLNDLGFWGERSSAPIWYSPGPHCHLQE